MSGMRVSIVDYNGNFVTLGGGTAGTPAGGVQSVQGVSGGTAVPVSVAAPTAIFDGTKNVTTASTRVALAASQALTKGVQITAKIGNTGIIYVGSVLVSSTVYMAALYPGDTYWVDIANLATVNIDASVSGEGVSYGGV